MAKYKLGDICEIVSGSTPKTSVAEYWGGDLKWITPAELNDNSYVITDSARKLTELGVKKTGLSPLPKGTVILSSRAPIGKVAIAGCEMYCNQGFKNLICSDKINNRYLYWFLKRNTEFLNSLGRGATFKEISKQIVASIEINVPELDQQLAAVKQLEQISTIIQLRRKQLQKLDELVKARFVEMFGDPDTNPMRWKKVNISFVVDGKNFNAINDCGLAYQLTKQLLVIRYLCKRLIDINAPSGQTLIREMRFYPQYGSEMFHGTLEELSSTFRVDYPGRKAKVYGSDGKQVLEIYMIN